MKIKVTLIGLQKHSLEGEPEFTLDMPEGATVGAVLERLFLPPSSEIVVLLNGHKAQPLQGLQEHDMLTVFPRIEGG